MATLADHNAEYDPVFGDYVALLKPRVGDFSPGEVRNTTSLFISQTAARYDWHDKCVCEPIVNLFAL